MRKGFAIALAVMSFGLGAWLSPRATAQAVEVYIPVRPERGERVTLLPAESRTCEVEQRSNQWVQCKGGVWRNLNNGTGYSLERATR